MSLRTEAIAAYDAAQTSKVDAARAILADVLTPFDCSALTVEYDANGAVVFTDGDIHLGVRQRDGQSRVDLVEFRDGDTSPTALVQITSLAQLGKVLPTYDPIDENVS